MKVHYVHAGSLFPKSQLLSFKVKAYPLYECDENINILTRKTHEGKSKIVPVTLGCSPMLKAFCGVPEGQDSGWTLVRDTGLWPGLEGLL